MENPTFSSFPASTSGKERASVEPGPMSLSPKKTRLSLGSAATPEGTISALPESKAPGALQELARTTGIDPSNIDKFIRWSKFLAACEHGDVQSFLDNWQDTNKQLVSANHRIGYLESQLDYLQEKLVKFDSLEKEAAKSGSLSAENQRLLREMEELQIDLEKARVPLSWWKKILLSLAGINLEALEAPLNGDRQAYIRALRQGLKV